MLNINDISAYKYINNINANNFDEIALDVYNLQVKQNLLYSRYVELVNKSVAHLNDIPFLPISFFKTHKVVLEGFEDFKEVFESSGTTNDMLRSKHYIADTDMYKASILSGFTQFYGDPKKYTYLALLPSYVERTNASLVYMANMLMEYSGKEHNGFYLNEYDKLAQVMNHLTNKGEKVVLIGVTFALLDFAALHKLDLSKVIVIETGGMKGRRKEMTREEVHSELTKSWNKDTIHSEYGMTELLSQAYSIGKGVYMPSQTMKVMVRDINQPLVNYSEGVGVLNIIDLANIYSCSFIETEDIGRVYDDGSFEVLGRMDNTALRGCSLMVV